VFRDELVNLFPDDGDAQRLSRQSFLLADFLRTQVPGYKAPRLGQRVMMHGHCHHTAIVTMDAEEALMRDMSDDVEMLDSGCCGMAGSFGFEANHYDVSMQVGDLVLLPAVRKAPAETLIVADGFSCREQIEQGTGRRAVHLAHALQTALGGRRSMNGAPVEDEILPPRAPGTLPREVAAAAVIAVGLAATGYALWRRWRLIDPTADRQQ
jgi:Fe-S oxidoreductase